jgi:hypothetical protein
MRQDISMKSLIALRLLSSGLVMSAALIAGCDPGQDPSSPEAKQQAQAAQENIEKIDEKNNEIMKKKNKGAPQMKNIKNGLKSQQ